MVIILQQTLEGGQRFVSTVVEGAHSIEETSFISNFSISSQHSISERSAVYKQRIDSLFGKATRVHNPFIPQSVEPLSIRINGNCVTPSALASPGTIIEEIESPVGTVLTTSSEHLEDEDAYSRVTDRGSVITDSLNHKPRSTSVVNSSNNHNNVSSIRITCDEEESETPQPQSFTVTSSTTSSASPSLEVKNDKKLYQLFRDIPGGRGGGPSTNNIMWRNGSYGDASPVLSEEKSFGAVRSSPGGMLQFPVEYLGSVPVEGNTTSLQDLQGPLRKLYLAFLSGKNVMSGQLAITSDGLRFEAPKIRLVNPFTTIAVWAAIKFVARGEPIPSECAFMPLISDPEGQDKSRLFGRMDAELTKNYLGCMTGSKKNSFRNPPIFACVMREASFSLDCHAFACKCAEDAIVVAANLYQSLVDKMRCGNKEGESGYGSLNRTSPSATNSSPNQNRSGSSASSTGVPNECGGGGGGSGGNNNGNMSSSSGSGGIGGASGPSSSSGLDDKREHRVVFSDSESVVPIRPPRRKKRPSEIPSGNLKRYNSDDSILLKMPSRRRSFRGNHYPGKVKKRVQISTPDETSSDSVNESIDQVLDRIVNPGGMSFNDLKPSYQELILKIALTLTQDQLYQKSKQAMKKQQAFHSRKKNSKVANSSGGEASDDNSQFLNHILKSFSKITSSKTGAVKKQLSKSISSGGPHKPTCYPLPPPKKQILKKPKENTEDPFMSFCSGCMCEKCSEKCYCSLPSKHNVKINGVIPLPPTVSVNAAPAACCVSPTIPGQVLGGKSCGGDKPRKLCGYDTDSCAESEKCYCSLQRVKSNGLKIYNINLDTETSDTDTNSYDLEPFNQPHDASSSSNAKTVSARSVEILSYHPSKKLANGNSCSPSFQTTNAMVHFDNALEDCESLEQLPPRPCTSRSHSSTGYKGEVSVEVTGKGAKDKVLLVTGSNPRLVFKEPHTYHSRMDHHQEGKRSRGGKQRHLLDIIEDECNDDEEGQDGNEAEAEDDEDGIAPEKVLSMKKTAEIAAMFTDLKLEQTTNVIPDLTQSNFDSIHNTEDSAASLDFEASLGYLP